MAADLPPIVKAAERCLVEVNKAVLQFSRAFRHELGADLRRQSAEISRLQIVLQRRFPWLLTATRSRRFHHRLEGRTISIKRPRNG